jgi:hypothetical protein
MVMSKKKTQHALKATGVAAKPRAGPASQPKTIDAPGAQSRSDSERSGRGVRGENASAVAAGEISRARRNRAVDDPGCDAPARSVPPREGRRRDGVATDADGR